MTCQVGISHEAGHGGGSEAFADGAGGALSRSCGSLRPAYASPPLALCSGSPFEATPP
jgi:hypothetical protein